MKLKLILAGIVIIAIIIAALYLRYGGVTHAQIVEVVDERAEEIKGHIDDRYSALDKKLDRIENKLDRILEIANRPLADGMQEAK